MHESCAEPSQKEKESVQKVQSLAMIEIWMSIRLVGRDLRRKLGEPEGVTRRPWQVRLRRTRRRSINM